MYINKLTYILHVVYVDLVMCTCTSSQYVNDDDDVNVNVNVNHEFIKM